MTKRKQPAEVGDNYDELAERAEYAKKWAALEEKKQAIAQQQKDLLNKAKKEGHNKTPIRKVAQELLATPVHMQAKRNVEQETLELRQYLADEDGQYSFLVTSPEEEEQEAA